MAALSRQQRLPSLLSLLTKRKVKRQTVGQQLAAVHMLSEIYNIPIRKAKPKKKVTRG